MVLFNKDVYVNYGKVRLHAARCLCHELASVGEYYFVLFMKPRETTSSISVTPLYS